MKDEVKKPIQYICLPTTLQYINIFSTGQGQEVFLNIRVEESDYFRRDGYDIHTDAHISISQAILGEDHLF